MLFFGQSSTQWVYLLEPVCIGAIASPAWALARPIREIMGGRGVMQGPAKFPRGRGCVVDIFPH